MILAQILRSARHLLEKAKMVILPEEPKPAEASKSLTEADRSKEILLKTNEFLEEVKVVLPVDSRSIS